jgi:hypothetical protein
MSCAHPDRLIAEVGSAVERRRRELGTAVVGHGGHRPGVEFDAWAR